MMSKLYEWGIQLYVLGIRIAAFFSPKAKAWWTGRQGLISKFKKQVSQNQVTIWMHCASLGEFEQGRPLLEKIKRVYPHYQLVLTFFSPSGYQIRKNYPLADLVTYLPIDTRAAVKQFVDVLDPDLVIIVKYEFWLHLINYLDQKNIPLFLIAGLFRPSQIFFRWYGSLFRKALHQFEHLFVHNEASLDLLKTISVKHSSKAGDPRIDRVLQIAKQARSFPELAPFCQEGPVLIAGSTWPPDEVLLAEVLNRPEHRDWRLIIAPHQLSPSHLQAIESSFGPSCVRYSQIHPQQLAKARVLIIDNIGMLASLYAYGQIAYIGGAFKTGLHNTLEPASFALPILFGPKYHKFEEAKALVQLGAAFCITNTQELHDTLRHLSTEKVRIQAGSLSRQYLEKERGATETILDRKSVV